MRVALLRGFVVAALAANMAYAAWHAGAFAFVGLAPRSEREPARLEQQVRPDAVRVLGAAAAAAAVAPAATAAADRSTAARPSTAPSARWPPCCPTGPGCARCGPVGRNTSSSSVR